MRSSSIVNRLAVVGSRRRILKASKRTSKAGLLTLFCLAALVAGFVGVAANAQTTSAWTWVAGSNIARQSGVYGTLGTFAAGNVPGGREQAVTWTDSSGNFWLFGGAGYDSAGKQGWLNDLWEFSPTSNQWAWIAGADTMGQPGVAGTLGTPAAGNTPGGRSGALGWTDKSGNLWLFGGYGYGTGVSGGWLNDLWEFDTSTREWAWVSGSSQVPPDNGSTLTLPGVFGTLGVIAAGNVPPGRESAVSWMDTKGDLWLFGGRSHEGTCGYVVLNDLWEFDPSLKEWGWMGGSQPTPCVQGPAGVYGTQGTPSAGNIPGGRYTAISWTDPAGNFWLFGGFGYVQDIPGYGPGEGDLNDLWEFNPATKQWTWVSGSESVTQSGFHGSVGLPAPTAVPGARDSAVSWTDSVGNLWLFGGNGYSSLTTGVAYPTAGDLNDLWVFDTLLSQWVWMGGGLYPDQAGIYGSLGQPASTNFPGSRELPSSWVDRSGNLWLFGGYAADSAFVAGSSYGYINDLWEYKPEPPATPTFTPAPGTFASTQTVTIGDATAVSTIYYAIENGNTTTASFVPYAGPITVSSTETIQVFTVGPGYSAGPAVSATYNFDQDFSILATPGTITVNPGQSTNVTVSVTPISGFASAVSFSCSGLLAGTSCSFSPATLTPAGTAASTTLTLTATTSAKNQLPAPIGYVPVTTLALTLCLVRFGDRRVRSVWILCVAATLSVLCLSACSGGNSTSNSQTTPPPPESGTVTVTATSGSLSHSTTVTLSVN
jgi:N-acetylneuraminic acid mutarotase